MSAKDVVFYLICALTWCVLLPVLLVVGALGMLCYAACAELADVLFGRSERTLDHAAAREIARRLCVGH